VTFRSKQTDMTKELQYMVNEMENSRKEIEDRDVLMKGLRKQKREMDKL